MDIERALADRHGVARRTELLSAGVPERSLGQAVRDGRVEKVARGVFALPWADESVRAASMFRAQIGCVTACEHWGLPLWGAFGTPHLVVPRARSGSRRNPGDRAKAVVHRTSPQLNGGPWVPVAQALDQAAWCTSPVGQLVLIDAALHAGILLRGDLVHFGERAPRRRAWIRRMASGAAESPPETVARVAMVTAGLAVREQVTVPGVGRVDFVVEDSLVVEIDGWAYHAGRDAFESDRARDRLLLVQRLPVMRFTAAQVRRDPSAMVGEIARVLGRAPRADFDRRMAWALGSAAEVSLRAMRFDRAA